MLESVIDDDSYLDLILSDEESVSNDERSEISENSDNNENIIDNIHETEIKPPGSKWSGPGPPEGRNRVEIGSK